MRTTRCDGCVRLQKDQIFCNSSNLNLHPAIERGINDLGFTESTPIQRDSIPPALDGRDVLACAMTGSGKTAAFVLPILQQMAGTPSGRTRALILTPTRELASQIHEHIEALARHTPVKSATVFGGVKPGKQEKALRAGVDIVVATPGRLLDLMQNPWARFEHLEFLVLDEADRMLDMGFLPDIRRILAQLPKKRQTMLFSATLPQPIVTLSRDLLNDPVRIDVERRSEPATGISQTILPVPELLKAKLLQEMLNRGDVETALVFTRTKHRANRLFQKLERAGISCERIHGNRSQPQREAALAGFKTGRIKVLVATDIAARGIDVEALPHVINFDVPVAPEDYIHRVGTDGPSGPYRRRSDLRVACRNSPWSTPSNAQWVAASSAGRSTASTTTPSPKDASRSRSASGSPPTAPAGRKSARAEMARRSAGIAPRATVRRIGMREPRGNLDFEFLVLSS